jgi:hypothetical protein
MQTTIYFDMDGTIADLYGVQGWKNDLDNGNTRPYAIAQCMHDMSTLARLINRAQKNGYRIGIISWLSKSGTEDYNKQVAKVKREWLHKHLRSVQFDEIHLVPFGTPKSSLAHPMDILFDDNEGVRNEWKGSAYEPKKIFEILKKIS